MARLCTYQIFIPSAILPVHVVAALLALPGLRSRLLLAGLPHHAVALLLLAALAILLLLLAPLIVLLVLLTAFAVLLFRLTAAAALAALLASTLLGAAEPAGVLRIALFILCHW
ncbi:hypothetical protein [Sphingopyxis sp. MSC1_008]|jgi:hypothetical protein|uniref:hypothetical protein n=1 Tax=Sphingopyxis sp. MSC1_008 TaxID=2909265 RepID=UPI0020BDD5BB|nr:hypothetical protein [Sphingopyxis sp. MSC1_008]